MGYKLKGSIIPISVAVLLILNMDVQPPFLRELNAFINRTVLQIGDKSVKN
jgi:hypothetical protein